MTYQEQQLQAALRHAKKRWGAGFDMFRWELQRALVRAEVLAILAAQDREEDHPNAPPSLATLAMQ